MAALKRAGVAADHSGQVGRLALPPLLVLCAAALAAPIPAAAAPKLPPGADAPPVLPPWVKPADAPVHTTTPQAPSAAGRLLASGKLAAASADPAEAWATVNICDTEKSPNGLGVRASMPGSGRDQLMFMRFSAQYWSPSRSEWITVPGGGVSRWVYAGSARFAARQTGWTFFFEQPPAGTTFVMRAIVEQQWRAEASSTRALERGNKRRAASKQKHGTRRTRALRKRMRLRHVHEKDASTGNHLRSRASGKRARLAVVRSETLLTKTGYEGVDGGDPAGTSKAMCLIW
jgi:hypothetical protein